MARASSSALRPLSWAIVVISLALAPESSQAARLLVPADLVAPGGFEVGVAAEGFDAPTMAAFDSQGRMIVAESGYGGAGQPKLTRLEHNGSRTVLAQGAFKVPLTSVAVKGETIYAADADTVYRFRPGEPPAPFVTELPGLGDHQANQIVVHEGRLFVAVGTVTNAAVVGFDNWVFGWLRDDSRRDLRDVPCEDVVLRASEFASKDPIGGGETRTSTYAPFGQVWPEGHVVQGDVRCNGAILVTNTTGPSAGDAGLSVYAWGLRNPYGLEVGPDGAIWATNHGFDARGSRPVEDAWDCLYRVQEGAWYGWPDYACDTPVTDPRFVTPGKPAPAFLLASHPTDKPPSPVTRFDPHAATNGFAFSPGGDWGNATDAFIALFGDFAPATGTVDEPQGFRVVRVDTRTGEVVDFLGNGIAGRASRHGGGGFEHPSDVTFGPDGAMYVTDWGVADVTGEGLKLEPGSGVVWRVARASGPAGSEAQAPDGQALHATALGPTFYAYSALTLVLFAVSVLTLWGRGPPPSRALAGAAAGLVGGVVLALAALVVGRVVFELPWWVAPRILASMVLGREAQASILEFDAASTAVGLLVVLGLTSASGALFAKIARQDAAPRLVAGGVLWGLAVWALLQFIVWPLFFPLVSDKAFPPQWMAAAFALYGLAQGALLIGARRRAESGRGGMRHRRARSL